jgi:hypothetical protein
MTLGRKFLLLPLVAAFASLPLPASADRVWLADGPAPNPPSVAVQTEQRVPLDRSLPSGHAEAFFWIETGGDQMVRGQRRPRLILVVRYGSTEVRRLIATCANPSRGSALAAATATELELALCDGEFWLTTGAGRVVVRRGPTARGPVVATFQLPAGIERAMKPID